MITVRKAKDRGHAQHGWLDSYHTFSFADYFDPAHTGFRTLRVINEDRVAPGEGFGTHPHRDMEILTYVIEGQLKHRDSMGHEALIKAGDVQKITAGTGITHSEFNASKSEKVHLLQIWILPDRTGLKPSYQEATLKEGKGLMALPVKFNQDATVYRGKLEPGESLEHVLAAGRVGWVQMVEGGLALNGKPLVAGDGAAAEGEAKLNFSSKTKAEFLLFDLK